MRCFRGPSGITIVGRRLKRGGVAAGHGVASSSVVDYVDLEEAAVGSGWKNRGHFGGDGTSDEGVAMSEHGGAAGVGDHLH